MIKINDFLVSVLKQVQATLHKVKKVLIHSLMSTSF